MGMHPLGRLIAQRMDHPDHRWSVRDVERQAREQGESLNRSTVSGLRNAMTPSITRANVFGLAAGLRVTPLTVALAAIESWGIETRPAEETDSLATIAIDPTLSDRDRRQLRAMVTDMRENSTLTKGSSDAVEAQKKPPAPSQGNKVEEVSVHNTQHGGDGFIDDDIADGGGSNNPRVDRTDDGQDGDNLADGQV